MLRHYLVLLLLSIGCMLPSLSSAAQVKHMRIWNEQEKTRLVLDLDQKAAYHILTLENPHRVVIDMPKSQWEAEIDTMMLKATGIKDLRLAQDRERLRIVFDLDQAYEPEATLLPPNGALGHRLMLDLQKNTPAAKKITRRPFKHQVVNTRNFVVAIDAGHGGQDPGAIGRKHKTHEKAIVLSVARKLQALVNQQPDMQAILIRQDDTYIHLRERTKIARRFGADIFISLHADSFKDPKAHGASVFILSDSGASSEAARWLAEKENDADLVGGVALDDKSNVLASVLLDLSQTATQVGSQELGEKIIQSLGNVTKLHNPNVQKAGFVVLKSPDIPSILVELGFLSNPKGESDLRSKRHQTTLAKAILSGLTEYIAPRPKPPMSQQYTWLKEQFHQVTPGETLTEIANHYDVPVKTLMELNAMSSAKLRAGQTILLPFET